MRPFRRLNLFILSCATFVVFPGCEGSYYALDAREQSADEQIGSIYSLSATNLEGEPIPLSRFDGKVTLIVNVASECGFTPQYQGLQNLQEHLGERGFSVLAFPSNEFGGQESGSAEQIRAFCTSNYGVDFPLFAKVKTKSGPDQSPVYRDLSATMGKQPMWNFCKYLVDRQGQPVGFFTPAVSPDDPRLLEAIEKELAAE